MTRSNRARSGAHASDIVNRTGLLALAACISLGGCVLEAIDSPSDDPEDPGADTGDIEGDDESGEEGGDDGDGGGDDGGTAAQCEQLEAQALTVLESTCAGCHGPDANTAGFGFVTDVDKLLLSGMLVPGSASDSPLYARIADGSMPPASAPAQPDGDDIKAVGDWIDGCLDQAPQGQCTEQEWITTATMVDLMLADIATISPTDRPFTRYLTLTHLHNIGYCDEDLETFRFGLNKAINSLSLDPLISRPEPIDEWRTIYRIDLRDYDWEHTQGVDKWEMLAHRSPYAFRLIDDDAEVLQDFTETDFPFMPADWLVHDATEPDNYYDLLDIPPTLQQLEAQLGLDIDQNIATREVDRAGFLTSGVSQSNRLYERHQLPGSAGSAFWLSYDFASNQGDQNLFANPLDFVEDGGEAIYNLPNGMQAYLITDAAGVRLDEAPIDIVTDPLQDDKVVRAGISCMSCHDAGLKLKNDELRTYVMSSLDFTEDTKQLVQELHPGDDDMSDLVDLGNQTFANAVAAVWDGPTTSPEPIIEVYASFEANVDLTRAAAELGVAPDALLSQLGQLDDTYAPLVTGVISRDTFEAKFAESICVLNLGEANDPACQ